MRAPAAPATPAAAGVSLASWLPIILIVIVFYFLLIRPQQKRQKDRNQLLQKLAVGDHVVTVGGLHGVVVSLDGGTAVLRVEDGTKMKFERSAISSIREKSEAQAALPAGSSDAAGKSDSQKS